jgi:hypothetical protein
VLFDTGESAVAAIEPKRGVSVEASATGAEGMLEESGMGWMTVEARLPPGKTEPPPPPPPPEPEDSIHMFGCFTPTTSDAVPGRMVAADLDAASARDALVDCGEL